jgi:hypothetical protein
MLVHSPDDLLRSSLPYMYLETEVSSLDGNQHDVQLYTDISAEWVSGDHTANAQWSYGTVNENSEPNAVSAVSLANWPSATSAKTYGTRTAYQPQHSVAHTEEPFHAGGQGNRPTGGYHPLTTPAKPTVTQFPTNNNTGGIAYHQVFRQQQLNFSETNQQADWGYCKFLAA